MFVEVRHPTTKRLLFRYDPQRDLVEIVERGDKALIDLTDYRDTHAVAIGAHKAESLAEQGAIYPERVRRGPIR